MPQNELTSEQFWERDFWQLESGSLPDTRFDPENPEFLPIHRLLRKHLPTAKPDERRTCLEIGCAPGRYLWYMWKFHGYAPTGIEYVAEAAEQTQLALQASQVPANILHADMFEYDVDPENRFHLVFSLGLIEHFEDISDAVSKHVQLTAPDGTMWIMVPNHAGINGWLLRCLWPELYQKHNHMNYGVLRKAIEEHANVSVSWGGYCGGFNLAPSNFCPWMKSRLNKHLYRVVERLHYWFMIAGRFLPDNALTSPYLGVIVRVNNGHQMVE